jgi:hypothetical protein
MHTHPHPTHPKHTFKAATSHSPFPTTTAKQPKPENQPKPQPKHGTRSFQQHPSSQKKKKQIICIIINTKCSLLYK